MALRTASAKRFRPVCESLERRDCPTVPTAPPDYTPPPPDSPPAAEVPPPAAPLAPTDPISSPTTPP